MGLIWAMSLPGVVCLLIVLASIERLGFWVRRRGRSSPASGSPLSAIGMDELGAVLSPGKTHELVHRRAQHMRRQDQGDGAPPGVRLDLDRGVLYVPAGSSRPAADA